MSGGQIKNIKLHIVTDIKVHLKRKDFCHSNTGMSTTKKILIYGGRGALGRECVSSFKKQNVWVCSIDLAANEDADANVIVSEMDDWEKQSTQVHQRVAEVLNNDKVDGIFNVAGGWAGGNAASEDLVKNANLMWKQSVWSSTITASLAAKHLNTGGVLTLPGAEPAQRGTAGMMGYGMAKAAVHQFTKSLGGKDSGLPEGATALCILPITLDTPMNRKFMPDADHTTWTPLEFIADMFHAWMMESSGKPKSGSLVKIVTKDSKSTTEVL